jgi:hypothetical protein
MSTGIAKPMFWASARIAVVMPMSWPLTLSRGPPLLPGLIGASVWIRPRSQYPSVTLISRPTALWTQLVTVLA